MTAYEMHGGHVVERIGERRVDILLLSMLRHHVDEDRIPDLVEFCSSDFTIAQITILLRHMGARNDFLFDRVTVSVQSDALHADLGFGSVQCGFGEVMIQGANIPETIVTGVQDRRLTIGDIVDHPYLPGRLPIERLRQNSGDLTFALSRP